MEPFTEHQVITAILKAGLVPLFTHDDPEIVKKVIDVSYLGGIRVFEFTNRKKNSFEVFIAMNSYVKRYPDFILGIGTVMDGATTRKFIDAGAQFVVSPILKPEMGEICKSRSIPWIPGCATLTEIINGRDLGAQIIKLFPGAVLGPGFVSSVMPIVPGLQLLISGGVEPTEKNISAWFKAGAACVGLGSQLFTEEIIKTENWAGLSQKIEACMTIIQSVKQ